MTSTNGFFIFMIFVNELPCLGFPGGSVLKNPAANAIDQGLIPGSGRSSREGYGNSL